MASKSLTSSFSSILALIFLLGFSGANIDQDRAECADQLVGLATCLPYVGGDAKTPTIDCCTGLKQVLQKSKKCLCVLIKDRNDPNLGVKINSSLALALPDACHVPANISECVALLHLAPNSADAKVFEGSANSTAKSNTRVATVPGDSSKKNGTSAADTSGGGRFIMKKTWFGVDQMGVSGILIWIFVSLHLNL